MIIEQVFNPTWCFTNALNAAADKDCNQAIMAEFYADCLRAAAEHGVASIDWRTLNSEIAARWPKGLERIKGKAWRLRRPPVNTDL